MGVLRLDMSCTASNDFLSLPAYYQHDSTAHIGDPFLAILQSSNITAIDIWKPLHTKLPKYNFSRIPPKLQAIKQMAIEPFIAELQGLGEIEDEFILPQWVYALVTCGIVFLVVAGVFGYLYIKRKRQRRKFSSREREGGEERAASDHYTVAAATVSDSLHATPPVDPMMSNTLHATSQFEPSAPLLTRHDDPPKRADDTTGAVDAIVRRLYPSMSGGLATPALQM